MAAGNLEGEIVDWNDMRKFDDDHDNEWFICEEKKMADLYGGDFIRVKYTSQGKVGYFCELCTSECNAKKSLESHCSGMKHLKKKDIWEKEKKVNDGEEEEVISVGPSKRWTPRQEPRRFPPPAPKRPKWEYYTGRMHKPSEPPLARWNEENSFENREKNYFSTPRVIEYRHRYESTPAPPPPPPIPRRRSPLPPKEELKRSPAGTLLQKLSECSVKTQDDADLALSVITSLLKSLKEYYQQRNESKLADLLMESELKMSTVKALIVREKLGLDTNKAMQPSHTGRPMPPPIPTTAADYMQAFTQSPSYVGQASPMPPTPNLFPSYRGSSSFSTPSFR